MNPFLLSSEDDILVWVCFSVTGVFLFFFVRLCLRAATPQERRRRLIVRLTQFARGPVTGGVDIFGVDLASQVKKDVAQNMDGVMSAMRSLSKADLDGLISIIGRRSKGEHDEWLRGWFLRILSDSEFADLALKYLPEGVRLNEDHLHRIVQEFDSEAAWAQMEFLERRMLVERITTILKDQRYKKPMANLVARVNGRLAALLNDSDSWVRNTSLAYLHRYHFEEFLDLTATLRLPCWLPEQIEVSDTPPRRFSFGQIVYGSNVKDLEVVGHCECHHCGLRLDFDFALSRNEVCSLSKCLVCESCQRELTLSASRPPSASLLTVFATFRESVGSDDDPDSPIYTRGAAVWLDSCDGEQ